LRRHFADLQAKYLKNWELALFFLGYTESWVGDSMYVSAWRAGGASSKT